MFSEEEANRWLESLAESTAGAAFHPVGGFKRNNKCSYDAYVAVGAKEQYGASIAIRVPNGGAPYFAIVRKAKGRRISEDRVPFDRQDTAIALFTACLQVSALGSAAQTATWTDKLGEAP